MRLASLPTFSVHRFGVFLFSFFCVSPTLHLSSVITTITVGDEVLMEVNLRKSYVRLSWKNCSGKQSSCLFCLFVDEKGMSPMCPLDLLLGFNTFQDTLYEKLHSSNRVSFIQPYRQRTSTLTYFLHLRRRCLGTTNGRKSPPTLFKVRESLSNSSIKPFSAQ